MRRSHQSRQSRRIPDHRRFARPASDAGVIAIVVALSLSTFVLGFAALAVDLGSAYVRKAELQSVANRLALAGAKGLPTITASEGAIDQIDAALSDICRQSALPGVCAIAPDGSGSAPNRSWMTDGDPTNGEVRFFSDPDGDTKYHLGDRVTDLALADVATAVQVKLAPSTVEFGLASAFGSDSAILTKSATGRVGTPLGSGILPFALSPGDLTAGQFCVRDPAFPLNPTPPPPQPTAGPVGLSFPPDPVTGLAQPVGDLPPTTPGQSIFVQLTARPSAFGSRLSNVVFHVTNSPDPAPAVLAGSQDLFQVTLPEGAPGSTAQVWATGTARLFGSGRAFVSSPGDLHFSGSPLPGADLCQEPGANRGFVPLARPATGSDLENLERNLRTGPAVNLSPAGGLLGTLGSALDCVSTTFAAASTCLSVVSGVSFDDALTAGLLQSSGPTPGRLVGDCGNGTSGTFGVDDSRLFVDPGFIDPTKGGSASALKDRLSGLSGSTTAGAANRGWVTSKVLGCPRLAVLPVLDPASVISGVINAKSILSFTYVWIDDDVTSADRGLHFTLGEVDSFRGYVIDPGYLPAVVAGSTLVGPYLGSAMPKQVKLIPDLGALNP